MYMPIYEAWEDCVTGAIDDVVCGGEGRGGAGVDLLDVRGGEEDCARGGEDGGAVEDTDAVD